MKSFSGNIVIMFISLVVLISILVTGITIEGSIDASGADTEIIERDFDVQFIIEPSEDPLDPLYGEKWSKMYPGAQTLYYAMISNIGLINDTFLLELEAPPRAAGWDWYFEDDLSISKEVTLTSTHISDVHGGASFRAFRILVFAPIDASKDHIVPIVIKARPISYLDCPDDQSKIDIDEMNVVVGSPSTLSITFNHPSIFYTRDSDWMTIPVSFTNYGTRDNLEYEVSIEERGFWSTSYRFFECHKLPNSLFGEFNWTHIKFNLSSGESYINELRFRPNPNFLGEDDIFQFRYIAKITGSNYWWKSEVITVIFQKLSILSTDHNESEMVEVTPGKWTSHSLNITNIGWSEDLIEDVYLVEPKGVKLRVFNDTGEDLYRMEVPSRSSRRIEMEFIVDKYTLPGPVDLQLIVKPFSFDPILLNLTLNVQTTRDMELISSDDILGGVLRMGPGEEKNFIVGIRNNGNTGRKVNIDIFKKIPWTENITISPLDDGWSYGIKWISQDIEPINFLPVDHNNEWIDSGSFESDIGYTLTERFDERRSIHIDRSEIIWVNFMVEAPERKGKEMIPVYPARIILTQGTINPLDEIDLALEVLYPDLSFEGPLQIFDEKRENISSSKIGDTVFYRFDLVNSGNWFSDKVEIRLTSDDLVIDKLWIDPLKPSQSYIFQGNFTISTGMDSIMLEIDPANQVIESEDQFMEGSSENSNILKAPIYVPDKEEGSELTIFALIAFILILVLLLSGILLYLRKVLKK